jgi:hypothetical protein
MSRRRLPLRPILPFVLPLRVQASTQRPLSGCAPGSPIPNFWHGFSRIRKRHRRRSESASTPRRTSVHVRSSSLSESGKLGLQFVIPVSSHLARPLAAPGSSLLALGNETCMPARRLTARSQKMRAGDDWWRISSPSRAQCDRLGSEKRSGMALVRQSPCWQSGARPVAWEA